LAGSTIRRIKKTSPAKIRSCAIMPDAFAKLKAGNIKLWDWGTECAYPSDLVIQK
jgi:hypothetical protein